MTFKSTAGKDKIREDDKHLIESLFKKKGEKLIYFGMPGEDISDIILWEPFLKEFFAVEINPEKYRKIQYNCLKKDLDSRLNLFLGDVDDLILNGKDSQGKKISFLFDIIFLDYYGGIYYRGHKRIDAIKKILEIQKRDFLLFITFNSEADKGKNEIDTALKKIKNKLYDYCLSSVERKNKVDEFIKWYLDENKEQIFRQKIYLPYLIKQESEHHGYKVHCYAPIFYVGCEDSQMMHFAFKILISEDSTTNAISTQSIFGILNLEIKECKDNRIISMTDQGPKIVLD